MESDWSDIRDRTSSSPEAFTSRVYKEQMSGKPRMSGARAALAYFHVPDDDGKRLAEFADRKQAMVVRLIEAGDFTAYPDALRFIIAVKDAGIGVAAASSSKNAGLFLRQIKLKQLRARARDRVRIAATRADAAGVLRRRRVGPGLRARKATSGDVPHRSASSSGPHPRTRS